MYENLPPIRAITHGPKHHWFGYYDKLQFDPTGRYVLGMEVDFEHRSPRPDDVIKVGMIDLHDGDRWIELGDSRAWCWQQGCMLQWLPGSAQRGHLERPRGRPLRLPHPRRQDAASKRTIPSPIYTISPDGKQAVAPDFRRINDMPAGLRLHRHPRSLSSDQLAPEQTGIWHVDLTTGASKLIISLAQMADIPSPHRRHHGHASTGSTICSGTPTARASSSCNRWRGAGTVKGLPTRMITAQPDGSDIRVVDDYGTTSHFIWRDPEHILAWSWHPSHGDAFYLYTDEAASDVEVVGLGVMTENGHCTYLPGNEVDPERHLSRPGALAAPLPLSRRQQRALSAGTLSDCRRNMRASGAATCTHASAPTAGSSPIDSPHGGPRAADLPHRRQ